MTWPDYEHDPFPTLRVAIVTQEHGYVFVYRTSIIREEEFEQAEIVWMGEMEQAAASFDLRNFGQNYWRYLAAPSFFDMSRAVRIRWGWVPEGDAIFVSPDEEELFLTVYHLAHQLKRGEGPIRNGHWDELSNAQLRGQWMGNGSQLCVFLPHRF